MSYTVFIIDEKVNFRGFKELKEAQQFCEDDGAELMLIFEGMSMDDIFDQNYSEPMAMYVHGKRYDVSKHDG
ncbi:MAG: hypothetical protein AAF846_06140 [Chloroflexota bacterium]